jgi:PAS domain S-box-containing protein
MSIIGLDGRFKRVNQAFEKLLGYSREELLNTTLFDLIHSDDRANTESGYEKLKTGEPIVLMENRLRRKDGGYSWVAWSYFPVPAEDLAYGVGRDISQIKRMNEVIQKRADELEQANRVKDEFLATLSHELRTPLTSILGWSRLLRGGHLSEDEKGRAIQIIQRNAEGQAKMIEDLLDVSRIITGKLRIEFQPVSVPPIVEMVVNTLRPAAEAKHLNLETNIDPAAGPVLGDPTRLQQIVTNLLSNAIKFTPEGGKVTVALGRIDSHARLTVRDTGIGITAEALPHIFERFTQVDSSNIRAHSGLGLGLAIVDYLVRQQGGTVSAESGGLGKGATFYVDLPLTKTEVITNASTRVDLFSKEAAAFTSSHTYTPTVLLNGILVLLVEDDNDTRELLKTLIEKCGARVIAVRSVQEALEEVERAIPDVIVSDIGMPSANGYDLIARIRALQPETGGRIPAIALTAYAGAADRRRALLAGFQTHLAKPVELDELIAVIASLVKV